MDKDNVNLIKRKRLCSGCGACTAVCRKNCISMEKSAEYNYPCVNEPLCSHCGLCLKVCPGSRLLSRLEKRMPLPLKIPDSLGYYIAWSSDSNIRRNAASGGVISSLAIFMLKQGLIDGAICVRQDETDPLSNRTFAARNESDILMASGSRYSPVSNCEALKSILGDGKRYAFIGKPCEIDALNELQKYLPELRDKIRLRISVMCACTPSRKATLKLLRKLKVKASGVRRLSYRGDGWPGSFSVETSDGSRISMPYLDAWNNCLSRYSCIRCTICDDPLGNCADITVGDAWDRKLLQNDQGISAVIVRTGAGRHSMDAAIAQKAVYAEKIGPVDIAGFQKSLVNKMGRSAGNTFAYNLVFLHKFDPDGLKQSRGKSLMAYFGLFKRVVRFLADKLSAQY
ncbi:MAG TPA: Coenzyme F420 hydrogenase/dehydrogenase, beta subunit C-terminal domain [Clostridia bacterium]|nr:Coenzyme F420 hydrogenase/dehydrogenase, beta subunit C-terminal domain [Clostridia bacterium]